MDSTSMNVVSSEMTVEVVFLKINQTLRRSAEGVLQVADYLYQFESHCDFQKLVKELSDKKILAKSTISQYITIARCDVLKNHLENLPPSFNSIYQLAKIEKNKKGFVEDKVNKGLLSSATKLETIRKWGTTKASSWKSITIQVQVQTDKKTVESIKAEAVKIAEKYGAVTKPVSVKKTKKTI